jgi:hypothetical protein
MDFEKIPISTNTVIAVTNFNVNMISAYESINVTHVDQSNVKSVKDRKKIFLTCPDGMVLGKSFGQEREGLVKTTVKASRITYFRNAISILMVVDAKKVNFKISSSKQNNRVKFQLTGCKSIDHAIKTITFWYQLVKGKNIITYSPSIEPLTIIFTTVMVNININLGFNIDREKFDSYINDHTDYLLHLESFGYTGSNIKVPINNNKLNSIVTTRVTLEGNDWIERKAVYSEFLNLMSQKERDKWVRKERFGTFLVFCSGKVIFSTFDYSLMKQEYEKFMHVIARCKHNIIESY